MVRDRIVMGIMNDAMQDRLLRECDLTLKKAIDLCRTTEVARAQHQEMESKSVVLSIQKGTGRHQSQKWIKNDQEQGYNSKPVSQNDNKSNTLKLILKIVLIIMCISVKNLIENMTLKTVQHLVKVVI